MGFDLNKIIATAASVITGGVAVVCLYRCAMTYWKDSHGEGDFKSILKTGSVGLLCLTICFIIQAGPNGVLGGMTKTLGKVTERAVGTVEQVASGANSASDWSQK